MARFFFHVVATERVDDAVGHEHVDASAAFRDARLCVAEITRVFLAAGLDISVCRLEIETDADESILVLPFGMNRFAFRQMFGRSRGASSHEAIIGPAWRCHPSKSRSRGTARGAARPRYRPVDWGV